MVKGFKGILMWNIVSDIMMMVEGNEVKFICLFDDYKMKVLYGIICVNVNNMVEGVIKGFIKNF